jgi:hypothetical protein
MIFPDGYRRAGFFEQNVYKRGLESIKEVEEYESENDVKVPEEFRQEIKEYIGFIYVIPQEKLEEVNKQYMD